MSDDVDVVVDEIISDNDPDWIDPQLPKGYISPSQLNTYRRCPKQYEFAYIKQLVRPPGISQIRGSAVHKGVEKTHLRTIQTGGPLPIEEGSSVVSDYFDERVKEVVDPEENIGEAKDTSIRMFRTYYRDAVPRIRPVRVEHTFKWDRDICGVPVLGIIDLVDSVKDEEMNLENDPENPRMVEVVSDLKTVSKLWAANKIENECQLTFYAIAENTDRVRIDFLTATKTGTKYTPVASKRDRMDKHVLLEDIAEVAKYIKQGVFPRCDPTGWQCSSKWCGYYTQCRGKKG